MKIFQSAGTGLALFFLIAGVDRVSAESVTITEIYDISPSGQVSVENVNGKISVTVWEGAGVKLVAVKSANSQEGLEGIMVNVKSSDSSLKITTTLPKRKRGWFGSSKNHKAKVEYVLQVPASVRLRKIGSVNGHVTIDGVQGGVEASTVNGGITASGLNGSIKLSTVNGGVKCETLTSSAEESIHITTVNGGVELKLPGSINADLTVGTVNGSIKSDLAFSETEVSGRRKLRATIGSGGLPVDLSTVNGGVRIRKLAATNVSRR